MITEFVTVRATSIDKNAPSRLRMAQSVTAAFGLNAAVAIEVAIAFAVSWKPFVKSNDNAVTMTSTKMRKSAVTCLSLAYR